jgi:hypothetical protein
MNLHRILSIEIHFCAKVVSNISGDSQTGMEIAYLLVALLIV